MKHKIVTSSQVIVFFGLVLLALVAACQKQDNTAFPKPVIPPAASQTPAVLPGNTQTSEGEVTLDVTSHGFTAGIIHFDIVANTHTVDLSAVDLKTAATLTVNGQTFKPVSATGFSGHHSNAQIQFEIPSKPTAYTLTIVGVPDVDQRVFTFEGE